MIWVIMLGMVVYKIFSYNIHEASAIGIIGGVDGPTTYFIASKTDMPYQLLILILVIGLIIVMKKSR